MEIQNLLVSGCSFTQDGIGGHPPTAHNTGGNSFIPDISYVANTPRSWASFIAKELAVKSFVNFAASGHGLCLINKTIQDAIKKFHYTPENTLVAFNITSLDRLDIVCDWNNADRCNYIPWSKDHFDYTYAKPQCDLWKQKFLNIDINDVEQASLDALDDLFTFLENRHFSYVFTMMDDYTHLPQIKSRLSQAVLLSPGIGMAEFAQKEGLLDNDNRHPSVPGHQQISLQVIEKIKKSTQ